MAKRPALIEAGLFATGLFFLARFSLGCVAVGPEVGWFRAIPAPLRTLWARGGSSAGRDY